MGDFDRREYAAVLKYLVVAVIVLVVVLHLTGAIGANSH
jgi:predicted nucleic acid-binding Zn ribbon protein